MGEKGRLRRNLVSAVSTCEGRVDAMLHDLPSREGFVEVRLRRYKGTAGSLEVPFPVSVVLFVGDEMVAVSSISVPFLERIMNPSTRAQEHDFISTPKILVNDVDIDIRNVLHGVVSRILQIAE